MPHEIVGWDGQRDTLERWTSHGMSHDPMGLWDGMDILQHFWTPMQQLEVNKLCTLFEPCTSSEPSEIEHIMVIVFNCKSEILVLLCTCA